MQLIFVFSLVTTILPAAQAAPVLLDSSSNSPVHKVIDLLFSFKEKAKKEKFEDSAEFMKVELLCGQDKNQLEALIKHGKKRIAILGAVIQKMDASASMIGDMIADLDNNVAVWSADIKAATKLRKMEEAEYMETHKDYLESIDALRRSLTTMKKLGSDSVSFGQLEKVRDMKLSAGSKEALEAFLLQAPGAYKQRSSGVVEMLGRLQGKFEDELTALEKKEMNAKHVYAMAMKDLEAQIATAKRDRDEKAGNRARALQQKANSKGDLDESKAAKSQDEKQLADSNAGCAKKFTDFKERQKLRTEEITAIAKAMEVLAGITSIANRHMPALVQTRRSSQGVGTAFSLLRVEPSDAAQQLATQYLQERSTELHSVVLDAVVQRVSGNPINKVKKMINDLIVRLLDEANQEADHKGWCDKELATNTHTRKAKSHAVEALRSEIEELRASVSKLSEEIAELRAAIADIDGSLANATAIREAEKASNADTIKDAADGQKAVGQAIRVLRNYYAKLGGGSGSTSLVQQQGSESPTNATKRPGNVTSLMQSSSESSHTGNVILAMLGQIEGDFARLEAETSSAETAAAKQYNTFVTESKNAKTRKVEAVQRKRAKKQGQKKLVNERRADLDGSKKELGAALAYYEKLKPSCVDAGVSYEDRVARRKEEIQSLQEALRILKGDTR